METNNLEEEVKSTGDDGYNRFEDHSKKGHPILYPCIKAGVVIAASIITAYTIYRLITPKG